MPADARTATLDSIRSANGATASLDAAAIDYEAIPRTYIQSSPIAHEEAIDLLTERLIDYNATVVRCNPQTAASAIRNALEHHSARRVLIPPDLPAPFRPDGFELVPDDDLSPAELDHSDATITLSTLAIAETGTIVLDAAAGQGRRAATLVPDVHICILNISDVVTTVPEAFARLATLSTRPLTFFSGPSATADIEMTRIKGVHGPRQLHILLLDNASEG